LQNKRINTQVSYSSLVIPQGITRIYVSPITSLVFAKHHTTFLQHLNEKIMTLFKKYGCYSRRT